MEKSENNIEFRERKRWLFFGLPFSFTIYSIQESKLTIKEGLLNQKTNDCYLYKIQDTTLTKSLIERIFGLGTIICHTGDITHPTIELKHIRHSDSINTYIFVKSEEARIKRKTVNMQNIGAYEIDRIDEE